jgi:hypothetical protein
MSEYLGRVSHWTLDKASAWADCIDDALRQLNDVLASLVSRRSALVIEVVVTFVAFVVMAAALVLIAIFTLLGIVATLGGGG